jgi:hypothetical protein
MASPDYVRAYINDLLVKTRGNIEDHISKLETALIQLRDAGLKVNAAKLFFCTLEIECLGYILTREGIKPQHKKRLTALRNYKPIGPAALPHMDRQTVIYCYS